MQFNPGEVSQAVETGRLINSAVQLRLLVVAEYYRQVVLF